MGKLKLKIIGLEDNGCVIRFTLGDYKDDLPIKGYSTVYFKFDTALYLPIIDDELSSEALLNREIPYLLVIPQQYENNYLDNNIDILIQEAKKPNSPIISVYYEDTLADVLDRLYKSKTIFYVYNYII